MTKGIDPDLFARLMKLSSETRRDLLEFIGQSPVDAEFVVSNLDVAPSAKSRNATN